MCIKLDEDVGKEKKRFFKSEVYSYFYLSFSYSQILWTKLESVSGDNLVSEIVCFVLFCFSFIKIMYKIKIKSKRFGALSLIVLQVA